MRRVIHASDRVMSERLVTAVHHTPSREVAEAIRALERPALRNQEADVLAAVLETAEEESYGYELARACGAPTGSIYRALARLEEAGMLQSREEDSAIAAAEQRPARRLYGVTPAGEAGLALWRAEALTKSPSARLLR